MQPRTIQPAPTSVAAFVGGAADGPVNEPVAIHSVAAYEAQFGPLASCGAMGLAVRDFFANGGTQTYIVRVVNETGGPIGDPQLIGPGFQTGHKGLYALDKGGLFNLLCIPPLSPDAALSPALIAAAAAYCERKRAMFLIDAPPGWTSAAAAISGFRNLGTTSANAAVFFPRLAGPASAPCGAIAGVFARTDAAEGVWKAPAGTDAALRGATATTIALRETDVHNLNATAINCLRSFATSSAVVVWGARTAQGADTAQSDWKYIPVRRLALFIETSIDSGTKWAVFEPNGQPLWSELANSVADFLQTLFLQGAFQGSTPHQAYFVRCDATTTTQADIDAGIVNILVGFAPLKPAEFVVLKLQQWAGCKLHRGHAGV